MITASFLRTSTLRLTLRYMLLYLVVLGIIMLVLAWSSGRYINADVKQAIHSDVNSLLQTYRNGGLAELGNSVKTMSRTGTTRRRFYLLTTHDLRHLAGNISKWPMESEIPLDDRVHPVWFDENLFPGDLYSDDVYLPALAARLDDGAILLVVHEVPQDNLLHDISEYLLESLPAIVLFSLLTSIMSTRAITRRIESITDSTAEIMSGNMGKRIPLGKRDDEFDRLSDQLNRMLDRIELVLTSLREVTDNVAHDLRSPIARIRNRMEVTLLDDRSTEEYREVLHATVQDASVMAQTINAVLQTAQANAGSIRAEFSELDLTRLIREIAELYLPVAEESGLSLTVTNGKSVLVNGNADMLAQAVGNLLDNAVKYTPEGGNIELALVPCDEGGCDVVVADSGPGVPARDRKRIVERFVRLDNASQVAGNGLGLSLVDAIARQHGATLRFEDNAPGLRVVLHFPFSGNRLVGSSDELS